jgi:prepilin-type N-terminal cleavage/methylation domain-containing protein
MGGMRVDLRRDDGFTLVELMIACVLTAIVMAAVGGLLVSLMITPRAVTARETTASSAQLAVQSIQVGVRNSSDFRLTSPNGTDQLLVARTAQAGSTIVWVCSAWYYSASEQSIRYLSSPSTIPAAPSSSDLASWTTLDTAVTPVSGSGIFTVSGEEVDVAFNGAVAGQSLPQTMITSVFSRAGSTGSPVCY